MYTIKLKHSDRSISVKHVTRNVTLKHVGRRGPQGIQGIPGNVADAPVTSVNGELGDVVLTQDDIADGSTYKQYSATDKTKLAGIEAGADVTDATNVNAAGALMESEVDTDIKTLSLPASTTISAFGATLIDDASASFAKQTLGLVIGTDVLSPTSTNTVTNKTINADNNTITNIDTGEIKASALVTEAEGLNSSDNDTSWPTTAAVKDYVDDEIDTIELGVADRQYKIYVTVGTEDADYITDGVDDHLQIQAAVDELSTENGGSGGTILIKEGTYDIGRRIVILSNDITIRGVGMSTKLVLADHVDQEIFVVGNGDADDPNADNIGGSANFISYVPSATVVPCNNVNFYDLYLDGNQANQEQVDFPSIRYGISATRNLIRYRSDALTSDGADINNVYFYNGIQNGLSIESHKQVTVRHIRSESNKLYGIWGESGGRWNIGPGIFTKNNLAQGIKIFGSGMCNISGWVSEKDQGGIVVQSSDRVQVSNFVIRDAGYNAAAKSAITLGSTVSETTFANGNIQNTWGDAIEIYGDGNGGYNKFDNITIKGTGQLTTNTYSDIHFKSSGAGRSKHNRFSRISSTSTTTNVPKYALDDDTGGHTDNLFRDCQFVAPYGTAVNGLASIDNQFINCTGIPNVVSKTADYTIKYEDDLVLADASAGAVTLYLPITLTAGKTFTIKKTDSSSNAVTLHGNGPDVDDTASKSLTVQGESLTAMTDGTQWWTTHPRVLAGAGLTKTNETLDVGAGTGIDVSASTVSVDSTVYRQGSTDVAVADGGTGSSTASGARTNLSAVGLTGSETIAGVKTFSSDPIIPDEAYGVGWNGSLEPPTKNAVYDKIETIGGGGGGTVDTVVAGNNIDVDATDPANPIVSVETLTAADISDLTATATELNYTDGVTSSIQTQIDTKVTGPASATDNAIVRYDATTGKLVQNSGVIIDDSNKTGIGVTPVTPLHVYEDTVNTNSTVGVTIEQDGAGDALIQYVLTGVRRWVMGVDNSDSDKFKMAANAELGSSTLFTLDLSGNATIAGTVNGRTMSTDGTKLDGIEALADVTDAANVAAAGAVMTSGLGSGVNTFLGTPSSANLAAAVTGETGTGALVFGTSPNIVTPTGIVKGDVGLGNVDNTSNATERAATATLTNKRITKRVQTLTDAATVTPDVDSYDGGKLLELSQTTTFANPTGTPTAFQQYILRIKSTLARSISFGSQYRAMGLALPTTTVAAKTLYLGMQWNADDTKWDVLSVVQET